MRFAGAWRRGQKFKKSAIDMDTSGESNLRRPAHVSGKTIRYVMHRTCSCLGDHFNSTFTRPVRRLIPGALLYSLLSLSLYSILDTPCGLFSIAASVIPQAAQHRPVPYPPHLVFTYHVQLPPIVASTH
jgi:hypothetical protein